MHKRTKVYGAVLVALGGAAGLATAPAYGQGSLERVEITGSSIKRIEAETALPVQIVTREEIARSGVASTEQLLQQISAASSQGGIVAGTGAGNSTYGFSSISLRALGEDRTLVLVNGRRLTPFAGGNGAAVNINAIPLAAIDRVEVLKDGASGLYGSDAIGGVVNFILTRDFQGIELSATAGTPSRKGGGRSTRASIVAGFGDVASRGFNATFSASFEKETALFAKDRKFAKTGNVFPYLVASATGQGNIEGAYNPGDGTTPFTFEAENTVGNTPGRAEDPNNPGTPLFGNSPGTGYGNPLAAQDNCEAINMFHAGETSKGGEFCQFDSNAFVGLVPKRELATVSANVVVKLGDKAELYGDALFSKSTVTQQFQPSPMRRSFSQSDGLFYTSGVNPVLLIRPNNPNYQIAADYLAAKGFNDLIGKPLAVTARVFDFGDRTSEDESEQTRFVAGLRGQVMNQDYDIAIATNKNKLAGTVPDGYFSQVAFARVVNDPNSDYNPWSLNQSAAFNAALAAAGAKYTGGTLDATSKSDSIDGKLSGELANLAAGPLQYAVGVQIRKEKLVTEPSPALETGDIAGLGGATPPVDEDRKINSVFGELVVPILKTLEGNLQVRNDDYNDVGKSTNYKIALRFQPMKEVIVRGSLGTGFRAPTLIDLWQPQTLGTSEQFNDPATGQTDLQVNSLTGGNPDLKPEKSKQRSIGIVIQPMQNLTIGVDYFNIRVKDIIALPSAQEVVSRFRAGDAAYAGLVRLTPGTNDIEFIEQTLQNVGKANTSGIDIEAAYRLPLGDSRIDFNLSGTYMIKFDQTSPGGAVSHKVGTIVEPDGTPVLSTNTSVNDGVVLRWKHVLGGTWTRGPWAATLTQNFTKGYRDGNDLLDRKHFVGSYTLWDAQVAFTGVKNLKLAIGARNLFDKEPPLFIPTSNQFQAGYDVSQWDPRGRFVYFTAAYKF